MKNQLEMVNGKKPYTKPALEVIEVETADIIAVSGEFTPVQDPWGGKEETW